jgi:two-component system response regulator YesN
VGLSPGRLTRVLRQGTGRTLNDLINRARCDRARQLLERGPRSLLDVALAVGFKDASYFTKVFRRQVGILPREYRERLGA